MNKLISIIVPIYNSSNTLDRCIKSVLNQTYKNYELILINDGSTDSSETICLNYQKKDSRIKYYYKKNSGAGDSRNFGIKKANGEYIGFIDADDEVLPEMYEKLINIAEKNKFSVVGCSNYDFIEDTNVKKKRTLELKNGIQNRERLILDILHQDKNAWGAVWNKIFKRDIFNKFDFPNTSIMEDYLVSLRVFNEYDIYFLKEELYIHYINKKSLTHRDFNPNMLKGLEVVDEITYYFSLNECSTKVRKGCNCLRLSLYEFICHAIWKKTTKESFEYLSKIYLNIKGQSFIKKYGNIFSLEQYLKIFIYYYLSKRKVKGKNNGEKYKK